MDEDEIVQLCKELCQNDNLHGWDLGDDYFEIGPTHSKIKE